MVLLLTSCAAGDTAGLGPSAVASLTLTPSNPVLAVNETVALTATLRDAAGAVVSGPAIAWTSLTVSVATVSSAGVVTGVAEGSAALIAASEGKADTATVTVLGTAPPPSSIACDPYTAPALPAPLRTLYVDAAAGSDGDAGTETAPWQTLNRATSSVQPGDLVLLRGSFQNQGIAPTSSGTAAAPIVFQVRPGGSAVISGGQYGTGILLDNVAYVVVDGVQLTSVQEPLVIQGGAHHNRLQNLYVHDAGSSKILGDAADNRLEGSRFEAIGSQASNTGDAIFLAQGARRNLLVRNRFISAGHGAVWLSYWSAADATVDDNIIAHNDIANPWASALGLNGTANRTIVECNTIHHTANGSGANYARDAIEIEGTNNIVRFNLIHSVGASGLSLEGRSFAGRVQNARGNHVYNNTFYGMGDAAVGMIQRDVGVVQDNIIENNIFWQAVGFADGSTRYAIVVDQYNANAGNVWGTWSASGNIVRNNDFPTGQVLMLLVRKPTDGGNVVYTLSLAQSGLAGWEANVQVNPQLAYPPADMRLLSSSPAIDAGRPIAGVSYLGARPDLGALEAR